MHARTHGVAHTHGTHARHARTARTHTRTHARAHKRHARTARHAHTRLKAAASAAGVPPALPIELFLVILPMVPSWEMQRKRAEDITEGEQFERLMLSDLDLPHTLMRKDHPALRAFDEHDQSYKQSSQWDNFGNYVSGAGAQGPNYTRPRTGIIEKTRSTGYGFKCRICTGS